VAEAVLASPELCAAQPKPATPPLTAGIGLEKRLKSDGLQRSAVHDSAAQSTRVRQTLLQMQKLQRHRQGISRKLSQRRGQSTSLALGPTPLLEPLDHLRDLFVAWTRIGHSWILFSSSGRRRRGSRL
jgi:hypothetical protein